MHICVSIGYTPLMTLKTKDAGLRLRVERELREEFTEACRAEGRAASQVLRDFMREYVLHNRAASQQDLFETAGNRVKR